MKDYPPFFFFFARTTEVFFFFFSSFMHALLINFSYLFRVNDFMNLLEKFLHQGANEHKSTLQVKNSVHTVPASA